MHLGISKYSAMSAASRKVFNSQEKSFCPQEWMKQVCIHQNRPPKFPLAKGRKAHAGWVQRQQGRMQQHLNTRSCGGATYCHTEINDHSARLWLETTAYRKVPVSVRSWKIRQSFSSLMLGLSSAPASPAPIGLTKRPLWRCRELSGTQGVNPQQQRPRE